MKRLGTSLILLVILIGELYPQERHPGSVENTQKQKDLHNADTIQKSDNTAEYWLFGSIPVLVVLWGIGVWGWGTASKWHFESDGWGIEQSSYTGGADKWGHTWGIYMISRFGSYIFRRSGDSNTRAALKGLIYGQMVGLGIELGDGFGDTYGFAWGDMVWNLGGGLFALIVDLYPRLDSLIGFQMEYWPSDDHIDNKDKWLEITSDVSGQKYILVLKLGGVPYIQDTIMQYFQIDFGYYTRGYWYHPSSYKFKTRHVYIGFAFNLSRLSEVILYEGGWRKAISAFFKYYHPPIAYNPDPLDHTLGKTRRMPK